MRNFGRIAAALLAGAAPAGLRAQETASPAGSVQSAPVPVTSAQTSLGQPPDAEAPAQPEADKAPAAPKFQFRGADGKPLPPEIQRQLEEQFKDGLPPGTGGGEQSSVGEQEIVVTTERPRGSVTGDIPPELTFRALDLKAYGANNVQELIETLGPRVSSNRGREDSGPVVLLNGRRVSSLAEIARIPTEAIERMEVFPEELALSYGYPADQKVVNVVVFPRFSSTVAQLTFAAPTEGGRAMPGAAVNYLLIKDDTRFSFDSEYSRSGALLERERNVVQASGSPDLGRFRTLLPQTERLALNGAVSGTVIKNVSSTLNGSYEASSSESLFGLGAERPVTGGTDTRIAHLGTTLAGPLGRWQWTFTGNYDRTVIDTVIDLGDASRTRNEARSVNVLAAADLLLSGQLFDLPAGPVSVSVRLGADFRDFSSRSAVRGTEQKFDISRDRGTVQASLDVPLSNRVEGAAAGLGDLSVNANLQLERVSDFGTLRTFGYGLSWSPVGSVSLIASVTHEEGAPTVEQLGAPTVVTPNVRTFDFARGETVDVTRTFGGNPDLRADDRHVLSVGLNIKPFGKTDFTISADYLRTRIDDPIAAFPIATAAIEAAFPDRFTRDADGGLLRIGARPLNFDRSDQEQLRFGLYFTRPLGSVPPELRNARVRYLPSEAEVRRRLPPGATLTKVPAGSAAARRAENLTSRLYLSAYYTLRTKDEIRLRESGPVLDLLEGSAIDPRGGRPRHELELQAGVSKRGLGARISTSWQSGSTVSGVAAGPAGGAGDLRFSGYGTVNVNLFANLGERFGPNAPEWLKGTRISLGIANLFNDRPEVRDGAGATPINYQGAYLNPLGRLVSFGFRKVF
jgi:hypothetical protein